LRQQHGRRHDRDTTTTPRRHHDDTTTTSRRHHDDITTTSRRLDRQLTPAGSSATRIWITWQD
jgi:hypothetical protein